MAEEENCDRLDLPSTKELIRIALLVMLYKRRPLEIPFNGVVLQMNDHLAGASKSKRDEVIAAELAFLEGLKMLKWRYRMISATKLYMLDAEGVLYVERELSDFLR